MTEKKTRNAGKILAVIGIVLLFAIGFFVLGLIIDIQIIQRYDHTPVPFTFILPFVGALIGFFLASRTIKRPQ